MPERELEIIPREQVVSWENTSDKLPVEPQQRLTEYRERGPRPGEKLLIVGSGPNIDKWKALGAVTLDVDPKWSADHTFDANRLEALASQSKFDTVVAECLTIDPTMQRGVNIERFLDGVKAVLDPKGEFIMETAATTYIDNWRAPSPIPEPEKMRQALQNRGFIDLSFYAGDLGISKETVVKGYGNEAIISDVTLQHRATYYGKLAETPVENI